MKKCKKCNELKNFENFYNDKSSKDGKTPRCKSCVYKEVEIKEININTKKCKDCQQEKARSEFYRHKASRDGLGSYCSSCTVLRSIASRFKLNKKEYFDMMSRGCDSCGSFNKLCIDHDHNCCPGQMTCGNCIRGVLCNECNSAEGFLKTSKKALMLLNYMKKNNL